MTPQERQLTALTVFLHLEERARLAANATDLAFVMVNETLQLLKYRQAILWRGTGKVEVVAVSGVDKPDANAPFIIWLKGLIRHLVIQPEAGKETTLTVANIPEPLAAGWREWLPEQVLWCPFEQGGEVAAGLLLCRPQPWSEGEIKLTNRLLAAYQHAWFALAGRRASPARRIPRRWGVLLGLAALLLPLRLSVLAPAHVAPLQPIIVSAPLDGVIQRFHVTPNQAVHQGDLLFAYDDTSNRNRLLVAKKALEVAEAKSMRARQMAFSDEESKAELAVLEAEAAEKRAEMATMAEVLERSRVKADRDGVAVFGDVNDWLGKPVKVGEKILTLADPARVEVEVWLPVADAIHLEPGAEVAFFLNIEPTHPLPATVREISYEAQVTPDEVLSFRLHAALAPEVTPPRIGLRGTAKIHGEPVTLFYYIMRKPLAALRQWVGW